MTGRTKLSMVTSAVFQPLTQFIEKCGSVEGCVTTGEGQERALFSLEK